MSAARRASSMASETSRSSHAVLHFRPAGRTATLALLSSVEIATMMERAGLASVRAVASFATQAAIPAAPPRAADEGQGPYTQLILRGTTVINGTGAPAFGPADIVIEGNRIVRGQDKTRDCASIAAGGRLSDEVLHSGRIEDRSGFAPTGARAFPG